MGFIKAEIVITGMYKQKTLLALFDSGAQRNYIKAELDDEDTPDQIGFHIYEGQHDAIMANGDLASGERVRFKELKIAGRRVSEPSFVMMKYLTEDAIIGAELMQELGIVLDPRNHKIITYITL